MDQTYLKKILDQVAGGNLPPEKALEELRTLPFEDLGFANIDQHRNVRTGHPETIFCEGKTPEQTAKIVERMMVNNSNILATRANSAHFKAVQEVAPDAIYHEAARAIVIKKTDQPRSDKVIAVVTAGTSDIPVAEEAAITAETFGNTVDRIYDVGVAGIHRLFARMDRLQAANVLIVVAGMEGALASVVGGLVDKPVIAVPTSIGYGASFGGLSALLTMLNSCASGVGVVNIDNGFGAGCLAANINRL
ncbi:nickel pincer cofactor biosynthesis protein LarB [Bacilliculturomica massiliensis]|uniref:nickel pincer cofactor biosynthesis protein LarB n=1 Tax=Bacilliculturomica massiliensis TaxID=1917867 RepID=UPI001030D3EC|nr:nickel pincer cofactor biosynthesis protein LarB [Bacilliculturomica massiliensis]